MRVLIIGASGFIGRHVAQRFGALPDVEITATFRSRPPADDGNAWQSLELTEPAGLERLFAAAQPDLVAHLAAMADVRTCENQPERATAVNATATAAIAGLCERHGARLIFVSTEYVFDGGRGLYREDEPPRPNTHYGRTKGQAEQAVAQLTRRWNVVRTSIVYGWPEPGQRNFVPGLIESLRRGVPYRAPTDVYRTPIYVEHLADGIVQLARQEYDGIVHLAGADWVSMYDFAAAIAREFGLDPGLVMPAASGQPDLLGLDCARTVGLLGWGQPGLAEGLAAMRAAGYRQ